MIVRTAGLGKRFPVTRPWREVLRAPGATQRRTVLQDISLEVAAGEIFGLLGPNGAGKTTLFKILATLITPDEGSASVGGHDVRVAGPAVRDIVAPVLANERSLYWRLSADENLRLYAALQRLPERDTAAEIRRVLAVTGLEQAGTAMVGTFSSGMKQRLLIARALLGRPRILLLDEPTRSLDPLSARDFRRFLRDTVVTQEGCTVLLATHDADEVWELCDRVAVLNRGRLVTTDRTQALRVRVGGSQFRLWVRTPQVADAAGIVASLAPGAVTAPDDTTPGWTCLTVGLPAGLDDSARLVGRLTAAGIEVARVERAVPSLADLIERVLAHAGDADA